jgi:hypothetical protein
MQANIICAGIAAAIPKEASKRAHATRFKFCPKHIACHSVVVLLTYLCQNQINQDLFSIDLIWTDVTRKLALAAQPFLATARAENFVRSVRAVAAYEMCKGIGDYS